ncbi:DUF421 domain-containing protein [Saccharomonospora cyanea]|uniref:Putative membrane protein n=1 Tax=Saccharomonospora cyanea NA-134 TaxID=882082 RepID=H5XGN0_9PSEU|nr:YetF domain-containing protein [Saccharomonospora cyanea]EHR61573.1 putative membrane protein [Saccharomonospora cyanea NA-134]
MDIVVRALAIYLVIVVLFRVTGKRTMAQVTTVDLVLLLVISEATQQALLGDDFSITTAALAIITLVFLDRVADLLKFKSRKVNRLIEGAPVVLVEHGRPVQHHLRKEHISVDDILAVARNQQGLLRLDQIEYAILESSGGISIIPTSETASHDSAGGTAAPPGA